MVRFIMLTPMFILIECLMIYIPIWLDLLFNSLQMRRQQDKRIYIPIWLDLLFVRGIAPTPSLFAFTFQYGQIYYQYNAQNSRLQNHDLHSNMVRFIIKSFVSSVVINDDIYIPIWLDLLQLNKMKYCKLIKNLHSNMVRFIIVDKILSQVYSLHLHSNMVRFIIDYSCQLSYNLL